MHTCHSLARPAALNPGATARTRDTYRRTAPTYGGRKNAEWHFDALKRMLDRKEPDYKN